MSPDGAYPAAAQIGLAAAQPTLDTLATVRHHASPVWVGAEQGSGELNKGGKQMMDDFVKPIEFSRKKPLWGILLGIAIFSLGAAMVNLPRAIASQNWPTTQGRIISSEVGRAGRVGDRTYHADVSYRYSVNGREYVSDDIAVSNFFSGSSAARYAQQIVNRYPARKEVSVHYSPNNPAIAVLEPGIPISNTGILFFVFTFAIMGEGVLVFVTGLYSIFFSNDRRADPS